MLSDVEDELAEEIRRLRALLHRERRARRQRIEINQLVADTSGQVTRAGVAETIVGNASDIVDAVFASVGYEAEDRLMHFVHGPELAPDVAERWTDVPLDLDIPMTAVLRGDVDHVDLPDRAAMAAEWPLLAAEADAAGMESFVAWPIARERDTFPPAAVLALAWSAPHVLDGEERSLLREMLAIAAPAFERARRTEVDQRVADTLQLYLLPSRVPDVEQLEILTLYAPGRDEMAVGGDWYDVVALDGERTAIVVGDVVGHDIRAAAEMGQVRHVLASHLTATGDVATSLAVTDRYFSGRAIDTMATALVVVFHHDGELVIGSAGHLPPVVADLGTAARPVDCGLGPPLGSGLGGYEAVRRRFPRESILVAFTDGVVERRDEPIDDSIADFCRLLDHVIDIDRAGTARPLSVVRVREALRRRTEDPWRRDDAAAVVMRRR